MFNTKEKEAEILVEGKDGTNTDEFTIEEDPVEQLKEKAGNMEESTFLEHEKHYSEEKFWK